MEKHRTIKRTIEIRSKFKVTMIAWNILSKRGKDCRSKEAKLSLEVIYVTGKRERERLGKG